MKLVALENRLPLHTGAANVDHAIIASRNLALRLHIRESGVEVLCRNLSAAAFMEGGGRGGGRACLAAALPTPPAPNSE